MSVESTTGATFKAGPPKELFVMPNNSPVIGSAVYDWDVTADGSRFLQIVRDTTAETRDAITVVLNWTEALRR